MRDIALFAKIPQSARSLRIARSTCDSETKFQVSAVASEQNTIIALPMYHCIMLELRRSDSSERFDRMSRVSLLIEESIPKIPYQRSFETLYRIQGLRYGIKSSSEMRDISFPLINTLT